MEIRATAGGAISINKVGINLSGSGLWKIILFKIILKISHHIIIQIEKKNQDNSIKPSGTQAIGTSILPTIGRNQRGFRVFISISCNIHLLNKIIVKIDCIVIQQIKNIKLKFLFICRKAIANIRNIFHIPGKKFDFTGWLKSDFTSLKFINIFKI